MKTKCKKGQEGCKLSKEFYPNFLATYNRNYLQLQSYVPTRPLFQSKSKFCVRKNVAWIGNKVGIFVCVWRRSSLFVIYLSQVKAKGIEPKPCFLQIYLVVKPSLITLGDLKAIFSSEIKSLIWMNTSHTMIITQ